MAEGSISGRISDVTEAIENVSAGSGTVESVTVSVDGELYEVWPPDKGFEVDITNARAIDESEPQADFDVSITDYGLETPPDPAQFDVSITDYDTETPPDPASFDVEITDSRIV